MPGGSGEPQHQPTAAGADEPGPERLRRGCRPGPGAAAVVDRGADRRRVADRRAARTGQGLRRRTWRASSTPSSPPPVDKGTGSDCRLATASSSSMAAGSSRAPRRAAAQSSQSRCLWLPECPRYAVSAAPPLPAAQGAAVASAEALSLQNSTTSRVGTTIAARPGPAARAGRTTSGAAGSRCTRRNAVRRHPSQLAAAQSRRCPGVP